MAICKSVKTRLIKTTKNAKFFYYFALVSEPVAGAETVP